MTDQQIESAWENARTAPVAVNPVAMAPGIYFDVPQETYFAIPAVNKSSLALAKTSLAHYFFRPPPEDAPHFRMGSLVHAGKLEPEKVAEQYVVIPEYLVDETQRLATTDPALQEGRKSNERFQPYASPRATKVYKTLLANFLSQHPGKQEVSQEWFDNMEGMVAAMDRCPRSRDLFNSGWPEVTIIWNDPGTGLICKGRIDWLCENADQADVKTAQDIERWSVSDHSYHIQAASYIEGYGHAWNQMTSKQQRKFPKSLDPYNPGRKGYRLQKDRRFHFCVVEKVRPWTVLCAPVDDRVLRCGSDEYHFLLKQLANAKARQKDGIDPLESYPPMQPPAAWTLDRYYKENDYPLYHDYGDLQ